MLLYIADIHDQRDARYVGDIAGFRTDSITPKYGIGCK